MLSRARGSIAWLLVSLFAVSIGSSQVMAQNPADAFESVRQAVDNGLPETAIKRLEPIIADALARSDDDRAVRGVLWKIILDKPQPGVDPMVQRIEALEKQILAAPPSMRPVMQSVLANWYSSFFQLNRWQLARRTQVAAEPGDDRSTWDLATVLRKIDSVFQESLAQADELQSIPVTQYAEFLESGSMSSAYRPTLYDVIAVDAIDFYAAGEQAGSTGRDDFVWPEDCPIFDEIESFLAWVPNAKQADAPEVRAVGLYQALLRFHKGDADRSALLDIDLSRLIYGANQLGSRGDDDFRESLQRFVQLNPNSEVAARAFARLAESLRDRGDLVKAHAAATEGLRRFPDSPGGNACYNVIQAITLPSLRAVCERVWNDPASAIEVSYKNVDKIHFRLVPYDFLGSLSEFRWSPEQLNDRQRDAVIDQVPTKTWTADLSPTDDYKPRTELFATPTDVAPGSYFLLSSARADFAADDNEISIAEVWVSKLALVTRTVVGQGAAGGLVLDAKTGHPIEGAKVRAWENDARNRRYREIEPAFTDADGIFRFAAKGGQSMLLLASHGDQSLSSTRSLQFFPRRQRSKTQEQTVFFTDRSIYRPGQTIRYKGIGYSLGPETNQYGVIAGRAITVVFSDASGKEVERIEHRTNDYGSFSGSVTAPRGRLTGAMTLATSGQPRGRTTIRVEQYKRPKFEVKLQPVADSIAVGGPVTVQGKATAYTGAPVDGGQVQWRVVRAVRFPPWYLRRCWWMPPMGQSGKEIATGTATTDKFGNFEIPFVAKPDDDVPKDSQPVFRYQVFADVTDGSGETRSDETSIPVGYTTMEADVSVDSWLTADKPVEITARTETLGGQPIGARGVVRVYRLKQPDSVIRPPIASPGRRSGPPVPFGDRPVGEVKTGDPESWDLGEVVFEQDFETDAAGTKSLQTRLAAGLYRAVLTSNDAGGNAVRAETGLQVIDLDAKVLGQKVPNLFTAPSWTVEPGESFSAIWGSGYGDARAYVEVEHRGDVKQAFWTKPGVTQVKIPVEVTEAMRGGFVVRTTMVHENRSYAQSRVVEVPWTNKRLDVTWKRFVSKLEPGGTEKWTMVIRGSDAELAAAEMVATLYDASLDAFARHKWLQRLDGFYRERSTVDSMFQNVPKPLSAILGSWKSTRRDVRVTYWRLPSELTEFNRVLGLGRGFAEGAPMASSMMRAAPASAEAGGSASPAFADAGLPKSVVAEAGDVPGDEDPGQAEVDFGDVNVRKNLNETAFFFPHLKSTGDGSIEIEFTMPEALTRWKFMAFAHDAELRSGSLIDQIVTSKDLMVQPNPPRFVREGDQIEFTVKVSNQSPTRQTGSVRLTFASAITGDGVDRELGNEQVQRDFDIPAGQSQSIAWSITVPEGMDFLTYKAVASTGRLSDGEEAFLPVLSRKVLVTESMTLPIRGRQTKSFRFEKLIESERSDTLRTQSFSAQVVSNPSWYAVMALPYLMEYPHQCSEQTFNRLYANSLANHIANSDPRIRQVFDLWRATPALESPLSQNEDLKSVAIAETPWLRQAESESQSRRNVGVLFDQNRLTDEMDRAASELAQMQLPSGAWPWFPGGPANDYLTLYIATGFGRMRHLGVDANVDAASRAMGFLDQWANRVYQQIEPTDRERSHLSPTMAMYLYGRSFFLKDQPVAPENQAAFEYWKLQAKLHWLKLGHLQSQGHIAIAMNRFGDAGTAGAIMASLKERAVNDAELGMAWPTGDRSWWWYQSPIETQAVMIEAFDEVSGDAEVVEDGKVWLLKQKQTQAWKTTKSTADAIYALLLRGENLLALRETVTLTLGDTVIQSQPTNGDGVQAGTGFYESRFVGPKVSPEMGLIRLTKVDPGVAWGSVSWQYLEDVANVTSYAGTPLALSKGVFIKQNSPEGPKLVPIDGPVAVGDELVVRLVVKCDRPMEYVHLKDARASGTEPVEVLSGYRFQDGLGYYQSTLDTASHFFIDRLPAGTHVLEYSSRIQLRGQYETGLAEIQCLYAPEFGGHSGSETLQVD